MNIHSSNLSDTRSGEEFDALEFLYTLFDQKKLIIAVTLVILGIATLYAFFAQPVYEANTLIQVENNNNPDGAAVSQMAALFDIQSPASAEMEILKSRLVVGDAVDELQLFITASPNYLPIIGNWLSRRANTLSNPGIFGFGGYVYGNEFIEVNKLDVPDSLLGQALTLEATEGGYQLKDPEGNLLISSHTGEITNFNINGESGTILINQLHAKPGAKFTLVRYSRLKTIKSLQSQLVISEKGKQSGIIQASLEGTDAEKTASTLNAIGNAYVQQNIRRKAAEAEKSLTFLNSFLPQLKRQMAESEAQYTKFRDQHGTFNLGVEGQMSLEASSELQTKLLELEQKRRELAPRFQSSHPALKTIDTQIAAIKAEMAKIEKHIGRMPDLEQQLLGLMRNVQVDSEMYVNLLNSAQQLRLVKEGKVGNVRVIDSAPTPEIPAKPRKPLIVAIGLVLGLLTGIAIALARRWAKAGIEDPSDIESTLGLHVFTTVPHSPAQALLDARLKAKTPGSHVLAVQQPQDPSIESLRGLRSTLQFAMVGAKSNIVLITGPTPGIGKSFTSVNFSSLLGAGEKRILLIDGDIRKGHINRYFGLHRLNGLSELITGKIDINHVIHKNIMPNVDFISTGAIPPNPAELLLLPKTAEILNQLSMQYDLVIMDSAPVLAVSDTLSLARHAGTIFVVAKSGATTLGELDEVAKRLKQAGSEVSGIILNGVTAANKRYGTKYGSYKYVNYNYT